MICHTWWLTNGAYLLSRFIQELKVRISKKPAMNVCLNHFLDVDVKAYIYKFIYFFALLHCLYKTLTVKILIYIMVTICNGSMQNICIVLKFYLYAIKTTFYSF